MSGPRSAPRRRLPNVAPGGAENADELKNSDLWFATGEPVPFRLANTVLPGQLQSTGSAVMVSGVPVCNENMPCHCHPPRMVCHRCVPCLPNGSSHMWLMLRTCCRSQLSGPELGRRSDGVNNSPLAVV